MKIRNGHVSNSSSSSFVVMLHQPIETISKKKFLEYLKVPKISGFTKKDIKLGSDQLYNALKKGEIISVNDFEVSYEIELGDLCDMTDTEKAYNLLCSYPDSKFLPEVGTQILVNSQIGIIDIG